MLKITRRGLRSTESGFWGLNYWCNFQKENKNCNEKVTGVDNQCLFFMWGMNFVVGRMGESSCGQCRK